MNTRGRRQGSGPAGRGIRNGLGSGPGGVGGTGFSRMNPGTVNVRGGRGCGFRGSVPPAPYTGRGRGGLPRCQYYNQTGAKPDNSG